MGGWCRQGGLGRAGTSSVVLIFPSASSYGVSRQGAVIDPVLIKNADIFFTVGCLHLLFIISH